MGTKNDGINKSLAEFESSCRDAGLKLTHQRLEIFRELIMADDHPSAEILYSRLKPKLPAISLDTVYRTLNALADKGLITRVETSESLARFEVALNRHHHLICSRCGMISDFIWPEFDNASLPESTGQWGSIEQKSIIARGICSICKNCAS